MGDGVETGVAKGDAKWVDKVEPPEKMADFARRVGLQQDRVRETVSELGGKHDRGQHQKQLLAGFGVVRVFDAVPPLARSGPFAVAGTFRAAVRISNGQPCPFADQAQDVRGIAVKFMAPEGGESDLLVTNEGGRSHAQDASQFMDIADALVERIAKGNLGFAGTLFGNVVRGALGPVAVARALTILLKETSRKVESIATEKFWGSVVRLGGAAVKYSLLPHESSKSGTMGDAGHGDYLRIDLQKRLATGPLKFRIGLQFFVDEAATPVNDASVAWKADRVDVGELEIRRAPSPEDEEIVRRMAFNPAHGFEPLGITHARKVVYEASAKNRSAMSAAELQRHFAGPVDR